MLDMFPAMKQLSGRNTVSSLNFHIQYTVLTMVIYSAHATSDTQAIYVTETFIADAG